MSEEIKPALTPEEWAGEQPAMNRDDVLIYHDPPPRGGGCIGITDRDPDDPSSVVILPEHRHALAALALHGQPFGFTWEDVDLLREEARSEYAIPDGMGFTGQELLDLADRIAALLPPRDA